jgi:hypothetical protein
MIFPTEIQRSQPKGVKPTMTGGKLLSGVSWQGGGGS